MKEPSIEQKTQANDGNYKAYTEIISRLEDVKDAIKKQNYGIAMDILYKPYPEFQITIYTELKESEDERMRNVAINACKYMIDNFENSTKQYEDAIAWLEKQGNLMKALQISNAEIGELIEKNYYLKEQLEKQGNNMGISETTKQELEDNLNKALEKETPESLNEFLDENPADKVKPKFKVGDWVVYENRVGLIIRMLKEHYIISFDGVEEQVSFIFNDRIAKWTIQDAKDGDVLSYRNGQWIFILKRIIDKDSFEYYALWSTTHNDLTINDSAFSLLINSIYPATKEQRKLLFQKMHETGYEWDSEKKELKKEEVDNLHNYLYGEQKHWVPVEPVSKNDKLYLMPDEQKPAWSEEDEEYCQFLIKNIENSDPLPTSIYSDCKKWLKSLKERYSWKPSDLQMDALHYVTNFDYGGHKATLVSLYEQLKKLKG